MTGVVIFGGTLEGRRIAEAFQDTTLELHICVATEYGATLLPDSSNIYIHTGRMDEMAMREFLSDISPAHCLDATHPYAVEVTANIRKACGELGLSYIRVTRREETVEALDGQNNKRVVYLESVEAAAEFLDQTQGKILITTGSRDLEKYTGIQDYQTRCIARVLPALSVLEKCRALGFEGRSLIGMQGPFGEELNYWMLKQVNASWMVTKSSGREGGYQEKYRAALKAGVNLVVIGRPEEICLDTKPEGSNERSFGKKNRVSEAVSADGRDMTNSDTAIGVSAKIKTGETIMTLSQAIAFLREYSGLTKRREIYLIGMGPGAENLLTGEARSCLQKCDVLIGAQRMLDIWQESRQKPSFISYRQEEILSFLRENPQYYRIGLVYSGDIGFFSGAKGMRELLQEYEIHPVSGIASPIYFLDRLGIPWDSVRLVSCHAQQCNIIPLIRQKKRVCALLGEKNAAADICRQLQKFGMEQVKITVGEKLSYPEERIFSGNPGQMALQESDSLAVVLFENPAASNIQAGPGIRDSEFLRGRVPMTKQEIRVLSLAKLELAKNSVVYDIGAGTGSVSVEAALQCSGGHVYAMERNQEAVALILKNAEKFGAANLEVITGEAPDCLEGLPAPTHVFIGGAGGRLSEIIKAVREKNREARFVINAITLETLAMAEKIRIDFPEYANLELKQINVSDSIPLGRYHRMEAMSQVYIISFGGRRERGNGE